MIKRLLPKALRPKRRSTFAEWQARIAEDEAYLAQHPVDVRPHPTAPEIEKPEGCSDTGEGKRHEAA